MSFGYLTVKGDWNDTFNYLNNIKKANTKINVSLHNAGKKGVEVLRNASPKDSGLMSESWGYIIEKNSNGFVITWTNDDIEGGYNVALLIQYGHGTGTGGYVKGVDYINPAMEEVFKDIADEVWKEISK